MSLSNNPFENWGAEFKDQKKGMLQSPSVFWIIYGYHINYIGLLQNEEKCNRKNLLINYPQKRITRFSWN